MIKVFIAEDDFRIADIHERFLRNIDGITVVGKALNANDTLKKLDELDVDLLLLDIYMPDMLGTDLIGELRRKEHNHINVIMITAAQNMDFFEESLKNGIFSYLIKPVTLEKFTEVIENFKKHHELLKSREFVDQDFIDQLLHTNTNSPRIAVQNKEVLPKGIAPLTLNKVIEIVGKFERGFTTEEMGVEMGASRTTARRYLEYLVSKGNVRAELEYGIVGRPERKYYGN